MATVNFSVPDKVRRAFNAEFQGENKSAVIARLMQQAVEERRREQIHRRALDKLLEARGKRPVVTEKQIRHALDETRKR